MDRIITPYHLLLITWNVQKISLSSIDNKFLKNGFLAFSTPSLFLSKISLRSQYNNYYFLKLNFASYLSILCLFVWKTTTWRAYFPNFMFPSGSKAAQLHFSTAYQFAHTPRFVPNAYLTLKICHYGVKTTQFTQNRITPRERAWNLKLHWKFQV